MTLNTRIIVTITLTLFFLIAAFFSVQSYVLLKQYNAFEERLVAKHLRQAVYLVNQRLEQLGNVTYDWSDWMETYRFTQTGDTIGYQRSGIDAIHEHLHLHFVAVADSQGNLLLNRFYNFASKTTIPVRELTDEYLKNSGGILQRSGSYAPRKGLYSTEIGPLLLTSYPVTDSAGKVGGRLLLGKLFDYEIERQLFAESPFRVDLIQLSTYPMPKDIAAVFPKLSLQRPFHSTNINSDISQGYALLPDFSGAPAFILKVTNSREYFQLKQSALYQLVIFTIIAVIGITAAVLYVLRRTVLLRIDHLESSVNSLSEDVSAPISLAVGGNDELTNLAENVERMVITIRESNNRLRSLFQTAHDGYLMFDGNGDILDVNLAAAKIFGYSPKEVIGKPAKHFLPIAFATDYDNFVKQTFQSGVHCVITECVTANGARIPVEASSSLVPLSAGSGIFVVMRDITERIHSERLQKTLLDIAQATSESYSLEEMLANIHRYLSTVVYAENFYVALYDHETGLYSFPYQVDRYDPPIVDPTRMENSLTDYVRRTKKPVLLDPSNHAAWKEIDEIQSQGASSYSWLGTPLIAKQNVIGVAVVQSYDEEFSYTQRDLAVMQLISGQIAAAIERKQAEVSLRQSETRYRQIFSMTVAVKLLYDPISGSIIDANPAACKFYGFSLRELKGKSIGEIELSAMKIYDKPPSSEQKFFDNYRIALHKLKNGELRTVELYSGPITLHDKQYVHSIVHDISSRIRTETENRRLAKLVESTAESITITDRHGTILYVNPAFSLLTGYSYEEAIGKNPSFLQSGKHDQEFYRNLWDTILSGSNWAGRMTNKKKDGTYYQVDAIIVPLKDDRDEVTSFAKIERDVTAEIEMQERLQQAQRMASIGQLTGGIAHNFNNLLTGILGNLELIRMTGSPAIIPLVSEAEKASQRAADLVKQLMAFSRKSQIRRKAVEVFPLLQEVVGMLRNTVDRRIEISLSGDVDHIALGDANQLHQVFLNICMNAVDALKPVSINDERQLHLALSTQLVSLHENDERLESDARPGDYCCVSIADTGSGMSSETLKQIFEPFFTTKEVGKGTGLGLATAYGIIRQHEGWILVESELNVGTVFRIYLPTAETGKPSEKSNTKVEPALIGGTETILIVDDEEMLRMLGKTILERNGYHVRLAVNGKDALEIMRSDGAAIDVVLLDLSMPVMSGRELLNRLPEFPTKPKVIVTTGLSDQLAHDDPIVKQYQVIGKPYRISELLQIVRKVLDTTKTD